MTSKLKELVDFHNRMRLHSTLGYASLMPLIGTHHGQECAAIGGIMPLDWKVEREESSNLWGEYPDGAVGVVCGCGRISRMHAHDALAWSDKRMSLQTLIEGVKARIAVRSPPRSGKSEVAERRAASSHRVRPEEEHAARHEVHVDVPVTIVNDNRETVSDRVRWGILSTFGNLLIWPFRLVGSIAERILNEGVSLVFRVASFVLVILIAPLALWLGFEVAVEYMKNRDVQGAFQYGLNALQELWGQFSRML